MENTTFEGSQRYILDEELAKMEAKELELRIEEFLLESVFKGFKKEVDLKTIEAIRDLYMEKLIFHLIYDHFEREPIRTFIMQLDDIIQKNQKESPYPVR